MKKLAAFVLVLMLATVARAQTFTTPDGAFSAHILDGAIDTSNSKPDNNLYMWQTSNPEHTESTAILEQINLPDNTNGDVLTAAVRDGALQGSTNGVLLSDTVGLFNGFHGRQFAIQTQYNDLSITYTTRVWASNTGHTIYAIVVYELSQNLPSYQNRVDWFLDTARLPK